MLSERLLRLLTAYVDGEVSPHQRRVVLRHLRNSPEARTFLKKLQDDANELRQLPAQRLGVDLSQKILGQIGDQVVRPIRISVPRAPAAVPRGFGLATAAAVLLALGFGSVYYLKAVRENQPLAVVVPESQPEQIAGGKAPEATPAVTPEHKSEPVPPRALVKNEPSVEPLHQPALVMDEPKTKGKDQLVGSQVQPPPDHFAVADINLAMKVAARDLVLENSRLKLLERLHSEKAQHIDLYCKQTRPALERMEGAFKGQGIYFVLAPDAVKPYLFGSKDTDYVLFTENVKPEEVLAILHQVAEQDRRMVERKGKGQFQDVLVNAVTERDHKLLSEVLGVDSTQLRAARPTTPMGVDIRRPIAVGAADAIVRNLSGKGGVPRPQPGKPAMNTPERLVVVGTCNPIHPDPKSSEIKRFLDSRKEKNADAMQMLMILRRSK